jgi:hypothetical protein
LVDGWLGHQVKIYFKERFISVIMLLTSKLVSFAKKLDLVHPVVSDNIIKVNKKVIYIYCHIK